MNDTRRRKNLYINQKRIDRARHLLGTQTETETIDRALALVEDYAQFKQEVMTGLNELIGKGGVVDHFSDG